MMNPVPSAAAAVLFVLAGAVPTAAAEAGSLHVAVLSTAEPLPSEAKALVRMEKALARPGKGRRFVVDRAPATEDEKRLAAAYLGPVPPEPPPALPAAWSAHAAVVLLELRPPTGGDAGRISGGLGAVLVFHPPRTEPTLVHVPAGLPGVSLTHGWSESVGPWLLQALALDPGAP
jgi:hypothetical protein